MISTGAYKDAALLAIAEHDAKTAEEAVEAIKKEMGDEIEAVWAEDGHVRVALPARVHQLIINGVFSDEKVD